MTYDEVVLHYETPARGARKLGYSKQLLNLWRKRGIPIAAQIQIEVTSRGALLADIPLEVRRNRPPKV